MTKQVDEFKNRLLTAMNYRNMTQIELSQKSGVDKGSISHYLKGTYEAKLGKAQKLSKALNVSLEWLMGADVPMEEKTKIPTINIKLLSELIKRHREKNNLSLRDFAKKANVSHTYISMLEKNYNPATKKEPVVNTINLNNIAIALGIGVDELIDNISNDTIIELKEPKMENGFGNRLKNALKYRGVSQKDLADKLNVDKSTITRYIKNEVEVGNSRTYAIANILNINIALIINHI